MDDSIKSFSLKIGLSNEQHLRIIEYLRSSKYQDREIKAQIMKAVVAFFDTFAIAEDPNSTAEDVLESAIRSFNVMSGHMSDLAVFAQNRYGFDPDIWKRFGLLPTSIASTYDRPPSIADAPGESTGAKLTRENQQRFSRGEATPTDEIDGAASRSENRELANREFAPVAQTASKNPPAVTEPEDDDDDEDDFSIKTDPMCASMFE